MRLLGGLGVAGAAVGAGAWLFACGGGSANLGAKAPGSGPDMRSTSIDHEDCEGKGKVTALDVNGDGKPDIRRVFDGSGHELCRVSDMNHDGKPDLYQYFDQSGALRRREYDLDDNGVMNMVETLEGGRLVTRQIDTMNQGKLDTWDTFDPASGKLVKRERDATSDGRVDQWWTFTGDKVTIAMDTNGDGKPDPEATVTMGGDGKPVPGPRAAGAPDGGAPEAVTPSSASGSAAASGATPSGSSDAGASKPPAPETDTASASADAGAKPKGAGKK